MNIKRPQSEPEIEPPTPDELRAARQHLSESFFDALLEDFERHGRDVIEAVRKKDAATYLEVVAVAVAGHSSSAKVPAEPDVTAEIPGTVAFLRHGGRPRP